MIVATRCPEEEGTEEVAEQAGASYTHRVCLEGELLSRKWTIWHSLILRTYLAENTHDIEEEGNRLRRGVGGEGKLVMRCGMAWDDVDVLGGTTAADSLAFLKKARSDF